MNFTLVQLEPFDVIGISVRTTNQNGQSQADIGTLWQRFFAENTAAKIPAKTSDDIYCLYTDYESDANGPYTTVIGCKVSNVDNIPDGLVKLKILGEKYRLYESTGKLPDCVLQTWQEIWQFPVERKYLTDFDVYGEGCKDPQNATVEIYLSVK